MLKSNPLFIAVLKSGKQIKGTENYFNCGWKEIKKQVDKVFFRLPDNNYFIMHSYEKYLYRIEGLMILNGKDKGKMKLEYLYFSGLRRGIVDSYRIKMFETKNDRYKTGDITKRQFEWNDVKNKWQGWK